MSKIFKLLILPGDGIGPEVMTEVTKLIFAVEKSSGAKFEITYDDIGGAAYDRYGTPLADSTLGGCKTVACGFIRSCRW